MALPRQESVQSVAVRSLGVLDEICQTAGHRAFAEVAPKPQDLHRRQWSNLFDSLGPLNQRGIAAGAGLLVMSGHAQQVAASDLPPGSMAAGILAAAACGDIEASQCPMVIIDYLAPSLDVRLYGTAATASALLDDLRQQLAAGPEGQGLAGQQWTAHSG